MPYPLPEDEQERLAALAEYDLLDTPAEEALDRIVRLAARVFDVPTALISLVDKHRQFFKARTGFDKAETSRDVSFCAHALGKADLLVVPDARLDPRFADNPMVQAANGIRFYAGAPLLTPGGLCLGTLCIVDDQPRTLLTNAEQTMLADLAGMVMDQFELRRLEAALHRGYSRFERIAHTSPDAILCADEQGLLTFWNESAERMFGYGRDQILGRGLQTIIPQAGPGAPSLRPHHADGGTRTHVSTRRVDVPIEVTGRRQDGSEIPLELSWSTWPEGGASGFGAIIRDISRRRDLEEHLYRLAHLDALTDMANREVFADRLAHTLELAPADLLLIDLDEFKIVNDTWGYSVGDAVLRTLARRIRRVLIDSAGASDGAMAFDGEDESANVSTSTSTSISTGTSANAGARPEQLSVFLGRMGGDEFAAILPGNAGNAVLSNLSRRLLSAVSEPMLVDGQQISVSACIGLASFPKDAANAQDLLANADLALYQAKMEGPLTHRFFVHTLRDAVVERRIMETELREALEQGQLELFYQPQIDLLTRQVLGAEALLRWRHPARGLLAPSEFINVLETSAIAPDVGGRILEAACRQAACWRAAGFPNFLMSVNLFGRQIVSGQLYDSVMAPIARWGLPPSAIEVEITETTILRRDDIILTPLRQLCEAGVRIAFDDYGTGYASLSLLKNFPLTRLKIDKSFVDGLVTDAEDAAVVQAIIFLARNFGLRVIAEGVETEAQAEVLIAGGCLEAQGYLFGKPVPPSEFELMQLGTDTILSASPVCL